MKWSNRFALLLGLSAWAVAMPASAQRLNFLACPVAQHLGPQRDLCFFALHDGVRYGLSSPPDWGNPQLGHQVLVEAEVVDGPQECGGVPIDGRVSVMPELSPECDEVVPPVPELLTGELPARSRLTEADRAMIEADPATSLRIVRLPALPVPQVTRGRTETIYFPFERDRATGPDAMTMVELARLAERTPGAQVTVRAYRGATLLDDGQVLTERPEGAIALEVVDSISAPDGVDDWQTRRAEILVVEAR
jgi:hypothetical protein